MGSKHISIRDEIYHKLTLRKKPDESYSDVIEKLLEDKKDIFSCFGLWKDLEIIDVFEEGIHKAKEQSKKRSEKFKNFLDEELW